MTTAPPQPASAGVGAVLGNRPFLLLWLSQAATQIGGNMVLYGLTVVVLCHQLELGRQRADPELPRPGGPLLGGRRRLCRSPRSAVDPDRHERDQGRRVHRRLLRGRLPAGTPPAGLLRLDRDRVLRPGGGGHDPEPGPTRAAPGGERDLHGDPQRRLRAGVRAAWPACRDDRRPRDAHPSRRGPVPPGRGVLLDAPAGAATGRHGRREPAPRRRRRGARRRIDARPAPRGLELHPREPGRVVVTPLSRHRLVTDRGPGRPRRRLRPGDPRPPAEGLRRWSSCRSGWGS